MGIPFRHLPLRHHRARLYLSRRPDQRDLQRGAAVFSDRRGISAAGLGRVEECGRMERTQSYAACRVYALLARYDEPARQSVGRRVVRAFIRAGVCPVVRLLVHGFPGDPDGDGDRYRGVRAAGPADRGDSEDVLSVSRDSSRPDCNCYSGCYTTCLEAGTWCHRFCERNC